MMYFLANQFYLNKFILSKAVNPCEIWGGVIVVVMFLRFAQKYHNNKFFPIDLNSKSIFCIPASILKIRNFLKKGRKCCHIVSPFRIKTKQQQILLKFKMKLPVAFD